MINRYIPLVFIGTLIGIFALITLHAPLTVWLSPLFSEFIKAWKELLLLLLLPMGVYIVIKKRLVRIVFEDRLFLLISGFALLHLLLCTLSANVWSAVAGLMIDLRFLAFFTLVYVATLIMPRARRYFLVAGTDMALVVLGFALLQVFLLPADILTVIGYGKQTIAPYLTVDNNPALVRINSTLRGPNPLGAYAGIILALMTAFFLKHRPGTILSWMIMVVLGVGSAVAVYASYSRSALVAAAIAVMIVVVSLFATRLSPKIWASIGVAVLVCTVGLLALFRQTTLVQQVIFHEDPVTQSPVSSNEQHVESLQEGVRRFLMQPFGAGVGSTGSASLETTEPIIIENQLLFIGHEAGWLGVILFILIFVMVMIRLWAVRTDWLARGVFASGIGLSLIGLLLPVWTDDTVSLVWWGLAAVTLASNSGIIKDYGYHAAEQKTTRTS